VVGIRLAFGSFDVLPLGLILLFKSARVLEEGGRRTWTSFELFSCFSPKWIIPSRLSYPVSHILHRASTMSARR
jgi:hypothetical protein